MATTLEPPARRPLSRRVMHRVRRLHLYAGLFLFPWAVLYGVTAFLFNHPTAFSDVPMVNFGRSAAAGTPLEGLPSPDEQAAAVIAALNERSKPATPYALGDGGAKYAGRDFLFATAKAGDRTFGLLYDPKTGTGTVRETTAPPPPPAPEPAPFAFGKAPAPRPPVPVPADGLKLPGSLVERFQAAGPTLLDRAGFPAGEVTVTSAPDLSFPVVVGGTTWTATYNPFTGTLSGVPTGSEPPAPEPSVRRFLLRLHLTHGYPGAVNAKWVWAVLVDAMAFALVFWGVSGLFMWTQLKATRTPGLAVLALSATAATALAAAMYTVLN